MILPYYIQLVINIPKLLAQSPANFNNFSQFLVKVCPCAVQCSQFQTCIAPDSHLITAANGPSHRTSH